MGKKLSFSIVYSNAIRFDYRINADSFTVPIILFFLSLSISLSYSLTLY
jgi:hypothetical protein